MSFALTFADKRVFDVYIIIDLIFELLQIFTFTLNFRFLSYENSHIYYINYGLYYFNNVFSFFTYKNSQYFDFLYICIFIRVLKIILIPPLLIMQSDIYKQTED